MECVGMWASAKYYKELDHIYMHKLCGRKI